MSTTKNQPSSLPARRNKLVDAQLAIILGVCALVYYMIWAIIATLFGKSFATWISTPLWGVPIFIIARWDRVRTQQDASWREFLKFPKLNYWRIARVTTITLLLLIIMVLIYIKFIEVTRPDIVKSISEDCVECSIAMSQDWQIRVTTLVLTFVSFFLGGYIEGKLSPFKYLSPYLHAAIGAFLLQLLHFLSIAPSMMRELWETSPVEESIGIIILANSPHVLSSVFGVWVAVRKRKLRKNTNSALLVKETSKLLPISASSTQLEEVVRQTLRPAIAKSSKAQIGTRKKRKHNRRS